MVSGGMRGFKHSGVQFLCTIVVTRDLFVPWTCSNGMKGRHLVDLSIDRSDYDVIVIARRTCSVQKRRDAYC